MGIISIEQTSRLYWLGRYAERTYTTIRIYFKSYDAMLGEAGESFRQFCYMIDIPDIYKDKEDFMTSYPFDETNPDSIISNLLRAYDNAIVLRESIGSETLSYIQLALYEMNKARLSESPLIELQRVIDCLLAFWGMIDDKLDDVNIRNIIKTGKRVERFDMYARLGVEKSMLQREYDRMLPRIKNSGMEYDHEKLTKIKSLLGQTTFNYYEAVMLAETLVEL